jgi:hypothetical protein
MEIDVHQDFWVCLLLPDAMWRRRERFRARTHDARFPKHAVEYAEDGVLTGDMDYIP